MVQTVKELGPGERFGDHLVGPAGYKVVDILGQRIPNYTYRRNNEYLRINNT